MSKKKKTILSVSVIFAILLGVAVIVVLALPSVNADGFDIDEDLNDASPTAEPYDWESALAGTGGGNAVAPFEGPGVISDEVFSIGGYSDTTHFEGGDKFLDPAKWGIITKNGGSAQIDLKNAYIVTKDNVDGDPILYVGFDRFKEEGDFHLDVEVNAASPVGGIPIRSAGDFAVVVDILKNPVDGNDLRLRVLKFTSPTSYIELIDITEPSEALWLSEGIIAVMNGVEITGTFNSQVLDGNKDWDDFKIVEHFTFVEMAIDLSELGIEPACPGFAWVHLKTRSSDAINSALKDLLGPEPLDLDTCGTKTFEMDFEPEPIDGLKYFAVYDHSPSNPKDEGKIGDLGSGEVELTSPSYSHEFDPIAPGELVFRFEVRKADGTTVILASLPETETINDNQDVTNPGDFEYAITLAPNGVNEVGLDHVFTATLTGELCGPTECSGTQPLVGVDVYYKVDPATVSLSPASPQETISGGHVTFTANSSSVLTATATAWVNAVGGSVGYDSSEPAEENDTAEKRWVDFKIEIGDDAVNKVGDDHVFIVTVTAVPGETVPSLTSLTLTGDTLAIGTDTCGAASFSGNVATCTVTVASASVGTVSIGAMAEVKFTDGDGNFAEFSRSTNGSTTPSGLVNSGPAEKDWVDFKIEIGDDDVNEVGDDHVFTVTVTAVPGDTTPTLRALMLTGDTSAIDTDTCGTASFSGNVATCTVTVDSTSVGTVSIGAYALVKFTDGDGNFAEFSRSTNSSTTPSGLVNSGPAEKRWVDFKIEIGDDAVNEVGADHVFTVTVTTVPGNTTPSLTSLTLTGDTSAIDTDTCGTASFSGNVATCTVTVDSTLVGTISIGATALVKFTDGDANFAEFSRLTNGSTTPSGLENSGPAEKRWVDFKIEIGNDAVNEVGVDHVFTVTVTAVPGDTTPSLTSMTFTGDTSAIDTDTCGTASFSGNVATCTVTVDSTSVGTVSIGATALVKFTDGDANFAEFSRSTNGSTTPSGLVNGGPAEKRWVDFKIEIGEDAVNEVGDDHVFTVTVTAMPGDTTPSLTLMTFTGDTSVITTNTCGTALFSGNVAICTVTVTSTSVKTVSIGALALVKFTDGDGNFAEFSRSTNGSTTPSGLVNGNPAEKRWVDAKIEIGEDDINGIGEPHTFTMTVTAIPGDTTPSLTLLTLTGDTYAIDTDTCGTASFSGNVATCTVTVISASVDTVSIGVTALVKFTDGDGNFAEFSRLTDGSTTPSGLRNSDPATKTWVDGSLAWLKHNSQGSLLGGATFEVCRTHDRFGTDITDECVTVLDNIPLDADSDDGEFQLVGLYLGRYTIEETVPPPGYAGDPFVETIELTLAQPDKSATHIWVNVPNQGCTPGFWQGGAGKKLWDVVSDTDWSTSGGAGTNPYIHTTLFNDFFTPYADAAGLTMMDLVSTGGGSADWRKAARDVVAAYLNASWGMAFPYTPVEVANMWSAAISSGDFAGLHNLLASANNPTNGYCPPG